MANTSITTFNRQKQKSSAVIDPDARWLTDYGKSKGWEFWIVGEGPMPKETIITKDRWRIVPGHLEDSELPEFAKVRVNEILETGYLPQGFVVIHEPPPPVPKRLRISPETASKIKQTLVKVGVAAMIIVGAVATVMTIVHILTMILSAIAFLIVLGLAAVGAITCHNADPILVLATSAHTWVAIASWVDEE